MFKQLRKIAEIASIAFAFTGGTALAQQGETVRVAFIDALSGPFANVGTNLLKSYQFDAERVNRKNSASIVWQIKGFDNKGTPQESLSVLQGVIDQGYRYVTSGGSSGVTTALSDAIAKYNSRNPGKEVLLLNYNSQDPVLTGEKCNYWHFRFEGDTSMKMEALTSFIKDMPNVKKIYMVNQNYSHGQQLARYFKENITRKRPDVTIVGDELIPLNQVKDFSPYIAKIKQSGADSIMTGSGGQDFILFLKAANDAGLKLPMFTSSANAPGTPGILAKMGTMEVYLVSSNHPNATGELRAMTTEFQNRFKEDFWALQIDQTLTLTTSAISKAKSIDPMKVAAALEGVNGKGFAGDVEMRASDHQIQEGLFISKWQKVDEKNSFSVENTGFTFVPVKYIDTKTASTSSVCQMKRP